MAVAEVAEEVGQSHVGPGVAASGAAVMGVAATGATAAGVAATGAAASAVGGDAAVGGNAVAVRVAA